MVLVELGVCGLLFCFEGVFFLSLYGFMHCLLANIVHTIVSFAFSARCGISLARYYPLLVGWMLDEWLLCASAVAAFGWLACALLVPHSFLMVRRKSYLVVVG
jgi:hypothetical protein